MDIGSQHFDLSFLIMVGLTVLGILVRVAIYFAQRQCKELAYRVVATRHGPTGQTHEQYQTVHEIEIEYRNTGNLDLTEEMFRSDIVTEFLGDAVILKAEPYLTMYSLHADVQSSGSIALIKPLFIKRDDSLYVRYIVANFEQKIHVNARIVNGRRVSNFAIRDSIKQWLSVAAMLCFGLLLITLKNGDYSEFGSKLKLMTIMSIPLVLLFIRRIWGVIREQHCLYLAWEVQASRNHLSGGI